MKRIILPATDGMKLAVWDSGFDGVPVVFIHGFPQTHLCWSGVVERLHGYRLITYDLRGFGESEKTGEASIQRFFHDHQSIVSALGLPKYHVVGHDWGGAVAINVARFHPEQIKSAVVLNTNYWRTDMIGMWHLYFLNLPFAAKATFAHAPDFLFKIFLEKTFNEPTRVPPEVKAAYRRMFSDKQTTDFWVRLYRNMGASMLRQASPSVVKNKIKTSALKFPKESLEAFQIPMTLIWGEDDTFNPVWIAKDMVERLRKAGSDVKLKLVSDSGHFVPEEQPEKVAQLLVEHLSHAGIPRISGQD